jgi:hypothetical protein
MPQGLPRPFTHTTPDPTPLPQYSPESNEFKPRGESEPGVIVTPGEVTIQDDEGKPKVVKGWIHVTPGGKVTIKPNASATDAGGNKFEPREYKLGDLSNAESAAALRATVRTMSMKANRILQSDSTSGGRDFRQPKDIPENRRSRGHEGLGRSSNATTVPMGARYLKEPQAVAPGQAYEFRVTANGDDVPAPPGTVSAGYDFRTSGIVKVAGNNRTPSFASVLTASNVWIKVYFDGTTTATVHTTDPGADTDTYEVYRITAGGVNMQYGDIHESRT